MEAAKSLLKIENEMKMKADRKAKEAAQQNLKSLVEAIAEAEAKGYLGDWVLRTHPADGRTELVYAYPISKACIPAGVLDPERMGTARTLDVHMSRLRKKLGVEYGVVVVDVAQGAPAARTPIRRGDVIVAVNQARFKSIEEFSKLVEAQQKGETVALLVRRGEGAIYVPMEVG